MDRGEGVGGGGEEGQQGGRGHLPAHWLVVWLCVMLLAQGAVRARGTCRCLVMRTLLITVLR